MNQYLILSLFLACLSFYSSITLAELPTFKIAHDGSFSPSGLSYTVSINRDALNCEFYVDSFAKGNLSHGSAYRSWVGADIKTQREVLSAGMYAKMKSINNGQDIEGYFLGDMLSDKAYKIQLNYEWTEQGVYVIARNFELDHFAFFVDVRRDDSSVHRIWLKNGNQDFTMESVFGHYPTYERSIGLGMVSYVLDPSPVYNQKHNCR